MLQGKKILLGITGSIAAYKSVLIVRQLIKAGAEVKVIMTNAARDFVSPLTLSTLSKDKVLWEIFDNDAWANHVMLGRWADLMLIAPLSCNTLSKMAHGACDNLLLSVYLSSICPVFVAPAMDEDMWHHPATKANLATIASYGNYIIPVEKGELASGLWGDGRMTEPELIIESLSAYVTSREQLTGKKALVTAGPTYEAIDPVRFLGNRSSGKMGIAIAEALTAQGADVTLVLGPSEISIDERRIKVIRVETAQQMYDACLAQFSYMDIAVMAAAVADYTPVTTSIEKIKKQDSEWTLNFKQTPDILKALGQLKNPHQLLVGFALETEQERENALTKLRNKNADLIVLNSLRETGAGFGFDTNKVVIFDREGSEWAFELKDKKAVAVDIVHVILDKLHAQIS